MVKTRLLSELRYSLGREQALPVPLQAELCGHMEPLYLPRGEQLDLKSPSLGFVAFGLLKEYVRPGASRPSFVQFAERGEWFVYHPGHYRHGYRALEPCWLLQVGLDTLTGAFPRNGAMAAWLQDVHTNHELGHALPFFLRELRDSTQRIELFLEEFGHAIEYLSAREVARYLRIDEKRCRALMDKLL